MELDALTVKLEEALAQMGYNLVRCSLQPGARRQTLQVMAEPLSGVPMSLSDCEVISRDLSPLMEVWDPLATAYNLEVSSPGIDRPLTKQQDFERFKNNPIKISLRQGIETRSAQKQKQLKGQLLGVQGSGIQVQVGEEIFLVSFDNIAKAELRTSETYFNKKSSTDKRAMRK